MISSRSRLSYPGDHFTAMTELNKQGRYNRITDDFFKLTGETPTSMHDFVKLQAAELTPVKPPLKRRVRPSALDSVPRDQ